MTAIVANFTLSLCLEGLFLSLFWVFDAHFDWNQAMTSP